MKRSVFASGQVLTMYNVIGICQLHTRDEEEFISPHQILRFGQHPLSVFPVYSQLPSICDCMTVLLYMAAVVFSVRFHAEV